MTNQMPRSGSLTFRPWQWVKSQIVGEVPKETELCEFDCRKQQCVLGEWANCDRRLRQAAGELMPFSPAVRPKSSTEKTTLPTDCLQSIKILQAKPNEDLPNMFLDAVTDAQASEPTVNSESLRVIETNPAPICGGSLS